MLEIVCYCLGVLVTAITILCVIGFAIDRFVYGPPSKVCLTIVDMLKNPGTYPWVFNYNKQLIRNIDGDEVAVSYETGLVVVRKFGQLLGTEVQLNIVEKSNIVGAANKVVKKLKAKKKEEDDEKIQDVLRAMEEKSDECYSG
jgi:hypothetical protein